MKTIGRHLVAEFYDCAPHLLDDVAGIRDHMLAAAEVVGATVLGDVFRQFEPHGVSGAVVIAESHLSVHTWPRSRYVAVDIFTCGGLDPRPGFRHLGRALGAARFRVQEIVRGLPEDIAADRALLPADVEVITRRPVEESLDRGRTLDRRQGDGPDQPGPLLVRPDVAGFDPNGPATTDAGIFGLEFGEAESTVVLVPVPWDATTSYGDGAAQGPELIRRASHQVDLYDAELGALGLSGPWRYGIHMRAAEPKLAAANRAARDRVAAHRDRGDGADRVDALCAAMNRSVYDAVRALTGAGKLVGLVGGDHSVSLGAIRVHAERWPGLGVLQVDAHADLRRAYEGFRYSHASIMDNVLTEVGGIAALTQVGVRDLCDEERGRIGEDKRVACFFDHELQARRLAGATWQALCEEVVATLPDEVYVSFDVDGLDPALCPGTGTPVPGGLRFAEATYLLATVARMGKRVVGFDLTEVAAPADGGSEWDGNVGARLLMKLIGVALASHGGRD